MSNKLCPYCGHEVYVGKHSYVATKGIVRCGSDGDHCPFFPSSGPIDMDDIPKVLAAWNRRFVWPDQNGDPVFSDSHINIELGDGSEHECFLQYQQHQWWATDIDATFGVRMDFKLSECVEIELIKENPCQQ